MQGRILHVLKYAYVCFDRILQTVGHHEAPDCSSVGLSFQDKLCSSSELKPLHICILSLPLAHVIFKCLEKNKTGADWNYCKQQQ